MEVTIKNNIYKQITDYCKINSLDVSEYINSLMKKLVSSDIYGEVPDFVKLKETKKEVREGKKYQKDIEKLQGEIEELKTTNENLLKDIEWYKETISEYKMVENRLTDGLVEHSEELSNQYHGKLPNNHIEINWILDENGLVDSDVKTDESIQKPFYDFSQFNSQTTVYEEEKTEINNNKPKKRKL